MDVLQIIKSDHAVIKRQLSDIEKLDKKSDIVRSFELLTHDLLLHIKLEGDYLYPELSSVLNGSSEAFLVRSQKNHHSILEKMAIIENSLESSPVSDLLGLFDQLNKKVCEHLELEESNIMPRLREAMPTLDREDLGAVFLDIKESERALAH